MGRQQDLMFVTRSGAPVGIGNVTRTLQRIATTAGVERVHSHRLRDTFATTLLADGAPITSVADLLGHTDVTMAQAYAAGVDASKLTAMDILDGV